MKTTLKEVQGQFNRFCRNMGKTHGFEIGSWSLDYNDTYGGYVIIEKMEGGGERHPLTSRRMDRAQLYGALEMANQAVELKHIESIRL